MIKYEIIIIHPVKELPDISKTYFVMDKFGTWFWLYFDAETKLWEEDRLICYWIDMPEKEILDDAFNIL